VYKVLKALSDAGLHLELEKCQFHKQEVKYLGFIIGTDGIRMDSIKITCILEWQTPKNVMDIQCFLGFANIYRRFIKDYSKVMTPLTSLTNKEGGKYIPFLWGSDQQAAFNQLKNAFPIAPILHHFDYEREIIVETDASDYVPAGILSQHDDDGIVHPVTFYSKYHSAAKCNYEIYDKVLLAIVRAFQEWRCDTWVCEYGGVGKDIVESGSIGLFYSQRNNLRFVMSGCFASVVSEDGE